MVAAAALAVAGGAGSAPYRVLAPGSSFFVGTPLACEVIEAKSEIGISCLERNPKTNDVYRESIGVGLVAGKRARATLIDYAKDGSNTPFWTRFQPHHEKTGLFPTGKASKDFTAHPGDRFAIGGTNIFCAVLPGNKLLCVVVKPKTLNPVVGTYALDASARLVEVGRINAKDGLDPVKAYHQPKLG